MSQIFQCRRSIGQRWRLKTENIYMLDATVLTKRQCKTFVRPCPARELRTNSFTMSNRRHILHPRLAGLTLRLRTASAPVDGSGTHPCARGNKCNVGSMHIARDRIGLSGLPGHLSPGPIRHCTISVLPFDVIVSYKCSKNAAQGHKLATDQSQRIYHPRNAIWHSLSYSSESYFDTRIALLVFHDLQLRTSRSFK